jgi:AcrR family transcriptional regulator
LGKAATASKGEIQRLDAEAWINGALDVVAAQGIDGVRVETLAKMLNVTKGSFYWHFADRDALLAAILNHWRRTATLAIIARLDQTEQTAAGRLRQLLKLPFHGPRAERGANVELSIRLWGRRDSRAATALAEVDQLRLSYIESLLRDCGFDAASAKARAILAYAFIRVATTLIEPEDDATLTQCIQALTRQS